MTCGGSDTPGISEIHGAHARVKDIMDALVIRDGDLTLVTMQDGDMPIEDNHGYGLYYRDCRFLSGYALRVNGIAPTGILSNDDKGYASVSVLANQLFKDDGSRAVEKDAISIRRDRIISAMQVLPYNPTAARSTLKLLAGYQGKK